MTAIVRGRLVGGKEDSLCCRSACYWSSWSSDQAIADIEVGTGKVVTVVDGSVSEVVLKLFEKECK